MHRIWHTAQVIQPPLPTTTHKSPRQQYWCNYERFKLWNADGEHLVVAAGANVLVYAAASGELLHTAPVQQACCFYREKANKLLDQGTHVNAYSNTRNYALPKCPRFQRHLGPESPASAHTASQSLLQSALALPCDSKRPSLMRR